MMIRRRGLSIVELVVVVMILGILAAIVMPKVLRATSLAGEKTAEYSAAVVRDAIDLYAATHAGQLPGDEGTEADFKADLEPYVRRFPTNPQKSSEAVKVHTAGTPLSSAIGGPEGWLYDNKSGEFLANNDPA